MSINRQRLSGLSGDIDIARELLTISTPGTTILQASTDSVVVTVPGVTVALALRGGDTGAGTGKDPVELTIYADGVDVIVDGNGTSINGNATITLLADTAVQLEWDPSDGDWVGGVMLDPASGGSPVIVDGIFEGFVEYDQKGMPDGGNPSTSVFTDLWTVRTTDATITPIVNPDPAHADAFDANGIILDDECETRCDFEIDAKQEGAAIGAGWKLAMSWLRTGGGAPVPMRSAVLVSDSYGTNAGAPPATWNAGQPVPPNPDVALVGPIGGKYYAQPRGQGVAATDIVWGNLAQWKKVRTPPALASLRVWIDPRDVVAVGGLATSAPNRAPGGAPFVFPAGGTGTTPLWSSTRFNGRFPGMGWDGTVERRLEGVIAGSFGGDCTFIFAVNEFAGSYDGNLGFSNVLETAQNPPDIVSGFIAGVANFPPIEWELERFDNVGGITHAGDTPPGAPAPYVYTAVCNNAGGSIQQRINGVQISTLAAAQGALNPQTIVTLGGHSNAVDVAFGPLFSQFELGTLVMFDRLLTASELSYWEHFVGRVSGILF